MITKDLKGLILSGGRSSRMGNDKGLIQYHDLPQREYLFNMLQGVCEDVYLSCKKGMHIPDHLNPIPDIYPIDSPLNGILSAIGRNPGVTWLTVPVDMPYISKDVLDYLLSHRDECCYATCFYDSDGVYPEPLLCIWEQRSFEPLQQFHREGNISPRNFLVKHPIKLLKSPFKELHTNINTKEDLHKFTLHRRGEI